MKALITSHSLLSVLIIAGFLSVTSDLAAAPENERFDKNEIKTLIMGINSENEGLRKSAIFFAGKYQVKEAVDALVDRMNETGNRQELYLISVALYKIGSFEGLSAVWKAASRNNDSYTKELLLAVYERYQLDISEGYAIK